MAEWKADQKEHGFTQVQPGETRLTGTAMEKTPTEGLEDRDLSDQSAAHRSKEYSTQCLSNLQNQVQSITSEWLAAIRVDFQEIQELMNENNQISLDFGDWVEAGAIDSLTRQETFLRTSKKSIHLLENQAATERDRMDSAVLGMKKITDLLVDPTLRAGTPDSAN